MEDRLMQRKKRFLIAGALFVSAMIISGFTLYARPNARPPEREIHITAKKFDFTPEAITLKKGEPVVLVISSEDRKHDSTCARLEFAPTLIREGPLEFDSPRT